MQSFKKFLSENYDVYLDMPHTKKFKATVKMLTPEGKEEQTDITVHEVKNEAF